jgi:hypothetical protein
MRGSQYKRFARSSFGINIQSKKIDTTKLFVGSTIVLGGFYYQW